jgi:class 3 adenylate cyclase
MDSDLTPVHPLRATVFAPRLLAYALGGAVLAMAATTPGPAAALLGWCLVAPWALRCPVPEHRHLPIRTVEDLFLPGLAILAGVPSPVLAAVLLPFLLGVVAVHGIGAGLRTLGCWALLVPFAFAARQPAELPIAALVAAGSLAAGFALAVAALTHLQAQRLQAARSESAARAAREADLAARLARYLPPAVHRAVVVDEPVGRRSRRRWLTVCFADLAGFTALTDAGESEEVVAMLDDFYGAMTAAAQAHGGTLDKFIGDAVMVFFGEEGEDEPSRARPGRGRQGDARACVAMALDMQRRLDGLRARWRDAGVVRALDLRVGVHSGWCTVGVFGPPQRRAYTVIGATVNTASRLETAAAPGQVLVSRATWLLLGDLAIRCRRLGPLRAKGLRDPVETFQVLREPATAPLRLTVDGLTLRLDPALADPIEARAALERALGAVPAELGADRVGAG